ncbi:uncharacterized protein BP5553_04398 [Venustampulla echinocandica]|uniref:F-box domain-containing protein n=1 Tax=Venustampulla echinocandica TaxID=2656787 RepID=A0A370TN70_9HELO|nr:uncharacterized protein BP5553_04398 [Venustampulla echinocandica]RDL36965.1 hypothetical protein BP5553_04398 [Venustampulla echinocandica]
MLSPASPSLLAIPPEILLTIISHLPTSNAFLPLVQTCRGLKTFFSTNAAIICNTHITKYHSFVASILDSTFVPGEDGQSWLIPMHSMVLPRQCAIFEDIQLPTSRQDISSPNIVSSAPKRVRVTDAELQLRAKMRLGVPGPMYLSFLETMGWDLRMRLIMFRNSSIYGLHLDDTRLMLRDDDREKYADEAEHIEYFEWAVERYVTRIFWSKCGRFINDFMIQTAQEGKSGVAMRILQGVWDKRGLLKSELGNILGPKRDVAESRGLLFGEIEKMEGELLKGDSESEKFTKCLLWYYGRSGVLGFRSQEAYKAQKPGKLRKHACDVKMAIAKVDSLTHFSPVVH